MEHHRLVRRDEPLSSPVTSRYPIAPGYAVDEEAQKLVAQGASLLEKRFSSEVFRREVARLLARHRRALDAATQPAVDAPRAQLAE